MGFFYQHYINDTTRLGVWRIEEEEKFFLKKVPLHNEVSHPYKRLQHLAGRFLLPALFDDFPLEEVLIADTRKPFLQDELYHFSISHCGNFAAALVSRIHRVGVDIELVTPRMKYISAKFISDHEKRFFTSPLKPLHIMEKEKERIEIEFLTILWSSKEAIFKWYGNGEVNFRNHIQLTGEIVFHGDEWMQLPFVFKKYKEVNLTVHARVFDGLVLAWVVSQ